MDKIQELFILVSTGGGNYEFSTAAVVGPIARLFLQSESFIL